jgi:secretory phospholipase A2
MLLFVFASFVLPIYSLNSTFNRFRRQANGCGPVSLNIDAFLREIGEEILIICCNKHDLCYDTCGQKQWTCDTTFLHCMIEACRQLLPLSNINRCQNDARILFWIVVVSGRSAYQQAQQQHQCSTQQQQIGKTRTLIKDFFINIEGK